MQGKSRVMAAVAASALAVALGAGQIGDSFHIDPFEVLL